MNSKITTQKNPSQNKQKPNKEKKKIATKQHFGLIFKCNQTKSRKSVKKNKLLGLKS